MNVVLVQGKEDGQGNRPKSDQAWRRMGPGVAQKADRASMLGQGWVQRVCTPYYRDSVQGVVSGFVTPCPI